MVQVPVTDRGSTHADGRGFKGLKQAIKLEFKMGQYDNVSAASISAEVLLMSIGYRALP